MDNCGEMVKYIHIMPQKSTFFNSMIIDMINNERLGFNTVDHLFIVVNNETFNKMNHYKNVIQVKNILNKDMKIIKSYALKCKYIILHSNTLSVFQLIKIEKRLLQKIIWIVWGHDLYIKYSPDTKGIYRKIRRFFGEIFHSLIDKRIKNFKALGIGFEYDAIEAKRRFGNDMPVVATPYEFVLGEKQMIDNIIKEQKINKEKVILKKPYKIMIGHSAFSFLNHISVMKKLKKFKNENIVISLVLSYGDKEYASRVKEYAIQEFGEKAEILEEYLDTKEYLRYLMSVDACILDYTHQSALGNIYKLIYMGKKLYLNKKGIIKLGVELSGIETYNVENIEEMDFHEFSKPINEQFNHLYAHKFDETLCIQKWKNTFRELN